MATERWLSSACRLSVRAAKPAARGCVVTIGLLQIDFTIPGSRSLKDKRRAMQSLKTRLRNRYNCSVAETEFKDQWGRSRLAICVVSDASGHVSSQLNEIVRFASNHHAAQLMDYEIEML